MYLYKVKGETIRGILVNPTLKKDNNVDAKKKKV